MGPEPEKCEIDRAHKAEIKHLQILLNPRRWTKDMHDAWHIHLPDTMKAFEALRNIELK